MLRKTNNWKNKNDEKKNYTNKGFTLIEFIIVMTIISILVLLASPKFMNYVEQAKLTQIKNDVRVVEDVLMLEEAKHKLFKENDNLYNKNIAFSEGISKNTKKLKNENQGYGCQINPEIVKANTSTKLNPEAFFYNKEDNKVFYIDNYNIEDLEVEYSYNVNHIYEDNNELNKSMSYKANKDEVITINPIIEHGYKLKENQVLEIDISSNNITIDVFYREYTDEEKRDMAYNLYKTTISNGGIKVDGLKSNWSSLILEDGYEIFRYKNIPNIINGETLLFLEDEDNKIVEIGSFAFSSNPLMGTFPKLNNLKTIGSSAFGPSKFTGEFPELENLESIGSLAFGASVFTGEFPNLKNLKEVGSRSLGASKFEGEFPNLEKIEKIESFAFAASTFEGNFPKLAKLNSIGSQAFSMSHFTGEFPVMESLNVIYAEAFKNSNFSDLNTMHYNGWDGKRRWTKK